MILNLTQHSCTPEQASQGVVDIAELAEVHGFNLAELLSFNDLPTQVLVEERADALAQAAEACAIYLNGSTEGVKAMIGGAPFLMGQLENSLREQGIQPVFAFSRRVSEEVMDGDTVRKVNVFKHLGFVEPMFAYKYW